MSANIKTPLDELLESKSLETATFTRKQLADLIARARAEGAASAGHSTAAEKAAALLIGAGDPMAFFADFCERNGYPSDGDTDAALQGAFYEGIRYCSVHSPAAADAAALSTDAAYQNMDLVVQRLASMSDDAEWCDVEHMEELADQALQCARAVLAHLSNRPAADPRFVALAEKHFGKGAHLAENVFDSFDEVMMANRQPAVMAEGL